MHQLVHPLLVGTTVGTLGTLGTLTTLGTSEVQVRLYQGTLATTVATTVGTCEVLRGRNTSVPQ